MALRLPEDFGDDAQGRPCLAARVEGKSSRARFGLLVHFTAPTVHAGFGRPSPLTLEMMNLGTASITLYEGMRICQLIIEEVRGAPASNPSDFDNQRTPAGQA